MTTCHFCGIPHKTPCMDEATAATCPIRLARAARDTPPQKGPELPLNDQTPTPATPTPLVAPTLQQPPQAPLTSDHPLVQLADISANVPPAPMLPPPPPPAPIEQPAAPPVAIDPNHYARFPIQPIHFSRVNNLSFWQANVIKYILRADAKNGIEDIEKAISYLLKERAYQLDPTSAWWEAQLPKGA